MQNSSTYHISYFPTKNTFCETWYLPHSRVHNDRTAILFFYIWSELWANRLWKSMQTISLYLPRMFTNRWSPARCGDRRRGTQGLRQISDRMYRYWCFEHAQWKYGLYKPYFSYLWTDRHRLSSCRKLHHLYITCWQCPPQMSRNCEDASKTREQSESRCSLHHGVMAPASMCLRSFRAGDRHFEHTM